MTCRIAVGFDRGEIVIAIIDESRATTRGLF